MKILIVCQWAILVSITTATAQNLAPHPLNQLDSANITWNEPGGSSAASMPIGNGDIGLNVWTGNNGDLHFYIAKTDAWGSQTRPEWDNWMKTGGVLMKLGAIKISTNPSNTTSFRQILHLRESEITIQEGATHLRVWVDANHPVIRVEISGPSAATASATLENWRIGQGDTIISNKTGLTTWYHQNPASADPHLAGAIFGASMETTTSQNKKLISIYPLTTTTATPKQWQSRLQKQIANIRQQTLEQTRTAHRAWWDQFWHRSWIFVRGDAQAKATTTGYILQRYITACAGRGAYPIKFNGSIFVVDNPNWKQNNQVTPMSADFRAWGGQYWFQNTRAMYWPRLQAGDFDMMLPLFNMYLKMLPGNEALVKQYYQHEGAYFQETTPFWGGLPFMGPDVKANYTAHYFTPILELSMMMLDYFEYTGDTTFARTTLLPIASAGITFFDQHFQRDIMAKLLLDPDNAIEMYWKVHDPAPDIAALNAILPRMISLPDGLASTQNRKDWQRLLAELPPLPTGTTMEGNPLLLPYTGPQTAKSFNEENPELYAVFPYRLYSLLKPELPLARTTFEHRRFKAKGCWEQDPMQAAMLGYTDVAKEFTSFNLTRKAPELKFPAFWATGHDYLPDQDNGGNGENGLQQMLMQSDGRKIILLPAWPEDWNAEFKLNAPYRTTVQGKVTHGKLTELIVTPAERRADIIIRQTPEPFSTEKTTWHEGFDRYDYVMDEKTNEITPIKATEDEKFGAKPADKGKVRCIVVAPKHAAPGNPWSWRGCYWDHEPQSEVELLKRGYHIAFIMCDPDQHWEAWYDFLTQKHGLSATPAFNGMSRGGINEFAWATTHPDKVSCIYADNPALRPESFQKLDVLAKNDIPLLHVCGSYDFLLRDHTLKVEELYHMLGGRISVVIKKGHAHHPHSMRDPMLIADWVEHNTFPPQTKPPQIPHTSWTKSYYYSFADTTLHIKPEDIDAICRGPLFTACYDRWDVDQGSSLNITGMTVIMPKTPAPGNPWIYHADAIGRTPTAVDLDYLAKGYYIVAAPLTSQSGLLPEQKDEVFRQMESLGLAKKPYIIINQP